MVYGVVLPTVLIRAAATRDQGNRNEPKKRRRLESIV
jgi:hypothetical protein